jgi:hypothetical protein
MARMVFRGVRGRAAARLLVAAFARTPQVLALALLALVAGVAAWLIPQRATVAAPAAPTATAEGASREGAGMGAGSAAPTARTASMPRGRVPASDDEVIETLPRTAVSAARTLVRARAVLAARPGDGTIAAGVAMRLLTQARATGDPRLIGQAQALIGRWWDEPAPADDLLLARATIRQSQHEFTPALADLDRLLARRPEHRQARLTRATVAYVLGDHSRARADCEALRVLAGSALATGCLAPLDAAAGRGESALAALDAAVRSAEVSPSVRAWLLGSAGEIAGQLGDPAAGRFFARALEGEPEDPYLLGAYADWLLENGRAAEVLTLLSAHTGNDGLLLRLAIAARRCGSPGFDAHRRELRDRLAQARARGESLHRREEARFRLEVDDDPAAALRLAAENLRGQREPADVALLVAAASRSGDRKPLREAARWAQAQRLDASIVERLQRAATETPPGEGR